MSDTTPDMGTETEHTETVDQPLPDMGNDIDPKVLAAEVDKWKAQARKHEERAKLNATAARELESVKLAALSDQEKAVELARQQARGEAFEKLGGQLVDMAVKAAVAGRNINADALLDGLDRRRFLTEDGLVDEEALAGWVDRIAPKADPNVFPDLGQGTRGQSNMALNGDPLLQSVISKLKS